MKLKCLHCQMSFELPNRKLLALNRDVIFPCPKCNSGIPIRMADVNGGDPANAVSGKATDPGAADPGGDDSKHASAPINGEPLKERILKTVKDLPPMPQVAQKARRIVADPKSSFVELAEVINKDQGIATQILKLANSPFYGISGNVSSVKHAASVLGVKTLMELLNLACASGLLGTRLEGYELDAGDLWRHSLAVAEGARLVAAKYDPSLADEAFSAGLIHDVGKIILSPYVLERKQAFDDFLAPGGRSFLLAEKAVLGFDHSEIAAEVCIQWNMPETIATAIGHHHTPANTGDNRLAHIIHLADIVAIMSGIGAGCDGMMYEIDPATLELLHIVEKDISGLMGEAAVYVEKTMAEL